MAADNDFYKFAMQNAVLKHYPSALVKYEFKSRTKTEFPESMQKELNEFIDHMQHTYFIDDSITAMRKIGVFDSTYLEYLRHHRFNPNEVCVTQTDEDLKVEICGPWYSAILWEVPLLAAISELYYLKLGIAPKFRKERYKTNVDKVDKLIKHKVNFIEFGTRRRFSFGVQNELLDDMSTRKQISQYCLGTSNVLLATTHNMRPIGTQAHEWFMFHGAIFGPQMATSIALDKWAETYKGKLGIALTDTYTTDWFLRSFDYVRASLWDGVRQDSGDPMEFADKIIKHYESLGIDPSTKTIVFSDSLDVDKVLEIEEYVNKRIKTVYGIGTNFTNDVGVDPLNIVIKMTACSYNREGFVPTVKLSDNPGKRSGPQEYAGLYNSMVNML